MSGALAGTPPQICKTCAELRAALDTLPHEAGCTFREWDCGQPGCGETHSTPCNCVKSKLPQSQPCTACAEKEKRFEEHTTHISGFLADIYAILVDPLSDGVIHVKESCDAIRVAAERSRNELQSLAELKKVCDESDIAREVAEKEAAAKQGEIEQLREAIQRTLNDNLHLADGDNCTLIHLKRALSGSPADPPKPCTRCNGTMVIDQHIEMIGDGTNLAPCPVCISAPVEPARAPCNECNGVNSGSCTACTGGEHK